MASQPIKAGSAYVEIYADNSSLQRSLKVTRDRMQRFRKSIASVAAGAAAVSGAIAGVAARFVKLGDAIDKASARTGASAEWLSAMGQAAELAGTDLETVEAGIRGMQRMLRNAERGLSRATAALGALGLSVQELQGHAPEKQFEAIAEALSQIEDPTRRAGLQMEIFGLAGQRLGPLLTEGAGGIQNFVNQAKEAGTVITAEQAALAAELGDAWAMLQMRINAAIVQIGSRLAPVLIELIGYLEELVAWMTRAAEVYDSYQDFWNNLFGNAPGGRNSVFDPANQAGQGGPARLIPGARANVGFAREPRYNDPFDPEARRAAAIRRREMLETWRRGVAEWQRAAIQPAEEIRRTIPQIAESLSSAGTFSAFAIGGLGAEKPLDETNQILKDQTRVIERSAPQFT